MQTSNIDEAHQLEFATGTAGRISAFCTNLDSGPFIPAGWSVDVHNKGGQGPFDLNRVEFYLSKRQQGQQFLVGRELRTELANKPTLNANMLDHLLANPHLIPEGWKGKCIFFWGTVYRKGEHLFVRCLYWTGKAWGWDCYSLGSDWVNGLLAATISS